MRTEGFCYRKSIIISSKYLHCIDSFVCMYSELIRKIFNKGLKMHFMFQLQWFLFVIFLLSKVFHSSFQIKKFSNPPDPPSLLPALNLQMKWYNYSERTRRSQGNFLPSKWSRSAKNFSSEHFQVLTKAVLLLSL